MGGILARFGRIDPTQSGCMCRPAPRRCPNSGPAPPPGRISGRRWRCPPATRRAPSGAPAVPGRAAESRSTGAPSGFRCGLMRFVSIVGWGGDRSDHGGTCRPAGRDTDSRIDSSRFGGWPAGPEPSRDPKFGWAYIETSHPSGPISLSSRQRDGRSIDPCRAGRRAAPLLSRNAGGGDTR
jgi:hypothetical protein